MEYNEWHYEVLNRFKKYDVNDILNFKRNHLGLYTLMLVYEWEHYCEDKHYSYDFREWRKKYNL